MPGTIIAMTGSILPPPHAEAGKAPASLDASLLTPYSPGVPPVRREACREGHGLANMTKTSLATMIAAIGSSFCYVISNAGAATAAEVKLLSAEVMKPALAELSGQFERMTGHKL